MKERLELEAKAKADKAKAAEERKRLEAESRAKQAEDLVARQRAADKAQRSALNSSPISPAWGSGGGSWFSKITQAASGVASAIIPAEESPKPTNPWNSDPWSRRSKGTSPNAELSLFKNAGSSSGPQHSSTASHARGPAPTQPATSFTAARSPASVVSSSPTLVSQEQKAVIDKQNGKRF